MALPRTGCPYSVYTDSSGYQVGCALFQTIDGESRPIGSWLRTMSNNEKNYSVIVKECLDAVYALTTLRSFLMYDKFVINTDQSSLQWLIEMNDPSGRLMRWRWRLPKFVFTVLYKKGKLNTQADALSQLPSFGSSPLEIYDNIPCFCAETVSEDDVECHCENFKLSRNEEEVYLLSA